MSERTAVLYARVSTEEQARSGYSLRQQLEALRAYAEREGYEVLEEIEDAGHSGAYLERPGLDRVRDLVESGAVSVVLAQDRDRFAREPAYLYLLKEEFGRHGCKLRALNDHGDESPEGQLTDGIMDQLAKFERAKFAERSRRGLDRKVTEGKVIAGPHAPYGFTYSADGNALLISEPEMVTVRRIFRMVAVEGASLGTVIRRLTDDGIPSPTGGNWHKPTLGYLIKNDLYLPRTVEEIAGVASPKVAHGLDSGRRYGLWTWNKRRQKKTRVRDENGGYRDRYETVHRPREEWSAVAVDLTDAGLERELVEAARERMEQNERRPPSNVGQRFWELSGGVARCAVCGSVLSPQAHRRRSGNGFRFYYTCRQRYGNGPRHCTNTRSNPAVSLEEAVWEVVHGLLSDPGRLQEAYEKEIERTKRQHRGDPEHEIRTFAARLEDLNEERRGYLRQNARGLLSDSELDDMLSGVDEERDGLQKALREATEREEDAGRLRRELRMVFARFEQIRTEELRHLEGEERRRAYEALRLRVEVDEKGDARLFGVFGQNIADVLSTDGPYRVDHEPEPVKQHKGVVSLDSVARCGG
jgi:site-specific DNA recombinase